MKNKTLIADLGLVYTAAVWGSTFFITKNTLLGINPLNLVAYRFLLSAFFMLIILLFMKKNIFTNFKDGTILGFLLLFMYIPQTFGLKYTSSSNSAFITGLFVVFVPLIYLFSFNKIPDKLKIVSIFLAITGLWILTGGLKHFNLGDLMTLFSSFACALHIITADFLMKKKLDPYVLNFQQFIVIAFASLFFSFFTKNNFIFYDNKIFLTIIFLAIFPTVSGYLIQLNAQKFTDPLKVAVIFSLEPVFGAIFAWTFGRELFEFQQLLGGIFIVTAMIISDLGKIKKL